MTQSRSSQTSVMEFSLDDVFGEDVFGEEAKPIAAVKHRPQRQERQERQERQQPDASHLMDEIFGEVEQVLDGSLIPPDEPVRLMMPTDGGIKFDIAAALSERYPQLTMPNAGQSTDRAGIDLELPDLPAPATALSKPGERRAPTQSKPQTSLSLFERMMIFTGCASAIAALAVWIVSQGILPKSIIALGEKLQATSTIAPTGTPEATVNSVDVKFSEYMQRSLAAIDRDAASKPPVQPIATLPAPLGTVPGVPGGQVATSANGLPKPNGPMALLPGSPNLPGMPANVMPATTSNLPAPVASAPVLPVQSPPDSVSRRELNQVMNRIVGMLERIAPGVSNRLQLPGAKAPAVVVAAKPTTTAKAPSRAALKVSESPAPVVNLPQRTLTGVIEMGDRSAVLFELNGVTQRVYVGESIGSTGWNLVEVAKDAAIFRRNGEVRNVGIGQKL
jgi:hypothetical protein